MVRSYLHVAVTLTMNESASTHETCGALYTSRKRGPANTCPLASKTFVSREHDHPSWSKLNS